MQGKFAIKGVPQPKAFANLLRKAQPFSLWPGAGVPFPPAGPKVLPCRRKEAPSMEGRPGAPGGVLAKCFVVIRNALQALPARHFQASRRPLSGGMPPGSGSFRLMAPFGAAGSLCPAGGPSEAPERCGLRASPHPAGTAPRSPFGPDPDGPFQRSEGERDVGLQSDLVKDYFLDTRLPAVPSVALPRRDGGEWRASLRGKIATRRRPAA